MKERLPVGTLVDGKYRLTRFIGAGGMGAVYEAVQVAIHRKVVVKVLHGQLCGDTRVIERFQQEARLAASIGHDNICEVTDLGTHEGEVPYLVMPLFKGYPFSDLLKQGTEPLPIERLSDIICQTLSALSAAHDAGIVHRDLKPDNIFITTLGDRSDFVKLLDFGISKVMESDKAVEITRTGTVVGTPFYMAPEQATGAMTIDHRLDIYAVGVILYEALTGVRPFDGDSYNEIMFNIVTDSFIAPSRLNPAVPDATEKIIIKAMAKDPAARYATAAEMRDACKEAAGISSFPALSASFASTNISSENLPFTPSAIRTAGSVPPVAVEETERWETSETGVQGATTEPARGGRRKLVIALVVLSLLVLVGVLAAVLLHRSNESPVAVPLAIPETPTPKASDGPAEQRALEPAKKTPKTSSEASVENRPKVAPDPPPDGNDHAPPAEASSEAAQPRSAPPTRRSRSQKPVQTKKAPPKRVRGRSGTYLIIEDDD
jgi:serine/threonine-protein kinase